MYKKETAEPPRDEVECVMQARHGEDWTKGGMIPAEAGHTITWM